MSNVLCLKKFMLAAIGTLSILSVKDLHAQTTSRTILPLQLEEQIPTERLDHFTADVKRKRLFVSALGNNTVEVIDVFSGKVIHSIQGLAEPQGPLYVADVYKLYVANAEDGKVRDGPRGHGVSSCRDDSHSVGATQEIPVNEESAPLVLVRIIPMPAAEGRVDDRRERTRLEPRKPSE